MKKFKDDPIMITNEQLFCFTQTYTTKEETRLTNHRGNNR